MNNVERQLKELILDEDFTRLQNLANEDVNLMDILSVSHLELPHSNFLAWLFDPRESHGLGDFVIKEFIKLYFKANEYKDFGLSSSLSVFDFVHYDFDDLQIRREYRNIDIVLLSRRNELCIVIENKINSSEKAGQLAKYRQIIEKTYSNFKHKIYVYLSLYEEEITTEEQSHYLKLDYLHIIKLIEQILVNKRSIVKTNVNFVLEQYLQTLKSMTKDNKEISLVAEQLYKKYKSAFDLVFRYSGPSNFNRFRSVLEELVESEKTIRPFIHHKSYIRFQPEFLYKLLPSLQRAILNEAGDLANDWLFLFEFNIRQQYVNFDFKIGMGDQESRSKLYNLYKTRQDFFTKLVTPSGKLNPQWHLAFQKPILTWDEIERYESDQDESVIEILKARFNELIKNDLPVIEEVLGKVR